MIEVDCTEMTLDEQLAMASAISEDLAGDAVGIIKDTKIVLDILSERISVSDVEDVVVRFVSRRKESQHYSLEVNGASIVIHTPDPLARSKGRKDSGQMLPPNLLHCPFTSCGFVTPYQELYDVHVKSHFGW